MIQFTKIQIHDLSDQGYTKYFAWYDTIHNDFLQFGNYIMWETWEEFTEYYFEDPKCRSISEFAKLASSFFATKTSLEVFTGIAVAVQPSNVPDLLVEAPPMIERPSGVCDIKAMEKRNKNREETYTERNKIHRAIKPSHCPKCGKDWRGACLRHKWDESKKEYVAWRAPCCDIWVDN